ncbi:MAG: hypothetical protein KAT05_02315 [Spirochaetes bacterium]|nr:hypothetical protein [Spirochaetota bacterium]
MKLKTFAILSFLLIQSTLILFSKTNENNKLLKRTIIISPVYYINKMKEYEYLSEIIRDVLKDKLFSTKMFYFVNFNNINENTKKIFLKNYEYIDEKKLIELTVSLGADVLLITKYEIINKKIIITVDAIDILSGKKMIKTSISANLGVEIFDCINRLANDIKDKMSEDFDKIEKSVINNQIEKEYGKEKLEKFIIEKDAVIKENELIAMYFGIYLGTSYDDTLAIVHNSKYKYKKKKDQIILFGNLTGFRDVEYSVFNFEDDKLIDTAVFINYPLQIKNEIKKKLHKQLIEILGIPNKDITDDKTLWKVKENVIEYAQVIGAKGYILHCIHYSIDENNKSIDFSLKNIFFDKTWFNKAIEISFGGAYTLCPIDFNNLFIDDKYFTFFYYTSQLFTPNFSFFYYPKNSFSIGFECKTGYVLEFRFYPPFNIVHNLYNEIRLAHKIGPPISRYKFILEYGAFFNLSFSPEYSSDLINQKSYQPYLIAFSSVFSFSYGPSILLGFEKRNKNRDFSLIFGSVINVIFGELGINAYNEEGASLLKTYESFMLGINAGFEIRLCYNYFKVLGK